MNEQRLSDRVKERRRRRWRHLTQDGDGGDVSRKTATSATGVAYVLIDMGSVPDPLVTTG